MRGPAAHSAPSHPSLEIPVTRFFSSVLGWSLRLFTLSVACLSIAMASAGCVSTMGCPSGEAPDEDGLCAAVDGGVADGGDATLLPDGFASGDGAVPPDARMLPDVGTLPDGCTLTVFYGDADEDGFGDSTARVMACTAPDGFVAEGGDCDDDDMTRSPGETERCDMAMVDDNCNMTANEGCECYVGQTRDCPGASDVGACVAGIQACDEMGRWMATCTGTVTPSAELCDNLDNDCNGVVDDGSAAAAACGVFANGTYECSFGTCVGTCNATHADCGGTAGCETALGTRTDCEACGADCGWACGSTSTGCDDAATLALGPVTGSATPSATCAPRNAGGMMCWGNNQYGELGTGGLVNAPRPVRVVGLPAGRRVVDAAMGINHACAVVAVGAATSGEVYCWGRNNQGQLGNTSAGGVTPVRAGTISDAVEVVAGLDYSCARLTTGAVMCWGHNGFYQLGQDDNTDSSAPRAVVDVLGATAIEADVLRTCAVVSSGVTCWGAAIGRTTTTFLGTVTAVAVGSSHTCALVSHGIPGLDGAVWCWGRNVEGQLGDLSTTDSTSPRGVSGFSRTGSLGRAIAVTAGGNHSCAIAADGRAYCWGANDAGQLGVGPAGANRTQPTQVGSLANVSVLEAGGRHTCAITTLAGGSASARSLYCWGEGSAGELGNGTTSDRSDPVLVTLP